MPDIISPSQCAFVPSRLITDNVLIVHELMHHLNTKRHGGMGSMAVKFDMSKAYECVSWVFLETIMQKMGLHTSYINLITKHVQSTSMSILIKGSLTGLIKPSLGLRQGDPISPYLFLMCTEGLVALLHEVE